MTGAAALAVRRNRQIERSLHQEVALRLKAMGCLYIAPPNGFYIPARSDQEKQLAARLVRQMKVTGGITPSAPDFVVLGNGRCGCIELKREATRTLTGEQITAGRLNDAQKGFRDQAERAGVPYAVCSSWTQVHQRLVEWGFA